MRRGRSALPRVRGERHELLKLLLKVGAEVLRVQAVEARQRLKQDLVRLEACHRELAPDVEHLCGLRDHMLTKCGVAVWLLGSSHQRLS